METNARIRPLAVCIFRREDSIFVSKCFDPKKREIFFRPIGGGIEFGEYGKQAVIREVQEEIGAAITNVTLIETIENLFTFNGKPGHEIVLLFQADFEDRSFYEDGERQIVEGGKVVSTANWEPLENFLKGPAAIYPAGILEILKRAWKL